MGAGFNLDANSLVPPYQATNFAGQKYEILGHYPNMEKLASLIFPGETVTNFEARLAQAIEEVDKNRLAKFVDTLMDADHYIGGRLKGNNIYQRFLRYCGPTTLLSFNYDAFLEIQLFKQDLWYPQDGFGVSAYIEVPLNIEYSSKTKSTSKVLHLHGTYLLYSVDFEISEPDMHNIGRVNPAAKPKYIFDPERLVHDFPPYVSPPVSYGYKQLQNRIIAPLPDKSTGLTEPYIQECYSKAIEEVRQSDYLVAIGYSFAKSDEKSYGPLLGTFRNRRGSDGKIVIIDPQAENIAIRLREEFPGRYQPIPLSFANWVEHNFPLQ